jgi:CheY-like chemotaxis protein
MAEEKTNEALGGANDESPKKELLIVDDDESYLKLIKKWMSDAYKATAVKSGAQALKFLEGHRPDLVLLDFEMPELNGGDVLQKMREKPETADIPVFFLTGNADPEFLEKIAELDPDGYLLKTMRRSEITAAMDVFFAKTP